MKENNWKLSDEIYCLGLYKKKKIGFNIEKDIIILNKRKWKNKEGIKKIKNKISQIEYLETDGFFGSKNFTKKTHNIYNDFYNHNINDLFLISKGLYSIKK